MKLAGKKAVIRDIITSMKKRDYLKLQIVLSMLLLVMGILIEWRGRNHVPGVAHLFLVIPGLILLLSAFLGKIKLAKHYYFIILTAGLTLILDLVVFLVYGLAVKSVSFYIGLVCSLLVESTMCFLFYILYLRIK